jgi:hypothetical protein
MCVSLSRIQQAERKILKRGSDIMKTAYHWQKVRIQLKKRQQATFSKGDSTVLKSG